MVHNPDWEKGQSTSVRTGINALPYKAVAAVFLLGDQPYVSKELIQGLVKEYIKNSQRSWLLTSEANAQTPYCLTVQLFTICAT